MAEEKIKDFGNDITVQPTAFDEKGKAHEYRVFQGKFCVKVLYDKSEAEDHATKLARQRKG